MDPDTVPPALELRLPDPALPLQAGATDGAPASKSAAWAKRNRLRGYTCSGVIAIVVLLCVLLLAAAYYYYMAMRARAFLTVTVEIPATSLSSSLGAGLKCDFAATLAGAKPPINFNDIALDSFALTDAGASEVQISPADPMNAFNQSACPAKKGAAAALGGRRRGLAGAALNATCGRQGLQRSLKSIKVGFTALSPGSEPVNVSFYTGLLTSNLTYDNVLEVVEEDPCLLPAGVTLEAFIPKILNITSVALEPEPQVLSSPLPSPSPSAGYMAPSRTATFSALSTDSASASASPQRTASAPATASGAGSAGRSASARASPSPAASPCASTSPTHSRCASATLSPCASATPSATACASVSPCASATPSPCASATPSPTACATASPCASATPSPSTSASLSASASASQSACPSASATALPSATALFCASATATPLRSALAPGSTSSTASASASATPTPSATSSSMATASATGTHCTTATTTPAASATGTHCTTATTSPAASATGTHCTTGTALPCRSATPSACPSPSPAATLSPTACPSSLPSACSTPSASPSPSGAASASDAPSASSAATLCASASPPGTRSASAPPSLSPSDCGSATPSPSRCATASAPPCPSHTHCASASASPSFSQSTTQSPSGSHGQGSPTAPPTFSLGSASASASAPSATALGSPSASGPPSACASTSATSAATATPPASASLPPSRTVSHSASTTLSLTASASLAPTSSYISPTGGSAAPTPSITGTLSRSTSASASPTATASAFVVEVRTVAGGGKCCPPPNGAAVYDTATALGYQDGAGTQAKFMDSANMAYTNHNNNPLFIVADCRNHLIRGIDADTYVVSTLAGGAGLTPVGLGVRNNDRPANQCGLRDGVGTHALFLCPMGVSGEDRNGAVYILDFYNNRIRRMELTSRNVTTVAGGGPRAGTCQADGVGSNAAFSSLGTSGYVDKVKHVMYFRDWHQILRINLTDFNVTTLAGGGGPTGAGGFGAACMVGWASAFGKGLFVNGIGTAALLREPRGMVLHPKDPNTLFFSTYRVIATLDLTTLNVSIWMGGGHYSNAEWPLNWPTENSAVGTSALFGGDSPIDVDPGNNQLIVGGHSQGANGLGLIDIDSRSIRYVAGGTNAYGPTVRDGFGSYPTFSSLNTVHFRQMGSGGGMYYSFDAVYGLVRQIQSSAFGPTNTPTPSTTPSQTPSPSKTATFTPTPSPSPTYGSRTVTTLAGGGGNPANDQVRFGFANGIGTAATFCTAETDPVSGGVRGITYASVGGPAIYIADTFNSLVRKLDLGTLNVTTLAGKAYTVSTGSNPRCAMPWYVEGAGTDARFCHTNDVEESGGILFVADYWNNAIRAIDLATTVVSTFIGGNAGGGYGCNVDGTGTSAKFSQPFALTISNGRMFILDNNAVVRMVVMATKVVTSLAGGGGPQAPGAGDSDGCHKTNMRVDGVGTTVVFNQPQDLAADATHVWVADYNSWSIRKVEISTGATTTFAGGNNAGSGINKGGALAAFGAPLRIHLDGFGNLVIVGGTCVFALTLDSAAWVTLVAGKGYGSGTCVAGYNDGLVATAGLGGVTSVTTGPGHYYVMDAAGGTVRSIDGGASLTVQTQTATPSQSPTLTPTRSPTPSVSPPPVVVRTVAGAGPGAGIGSTDGAGTNARFNHPNGIAMDSSSPPNFIIADSANNIVRKVSPLGVVTTLAGCLGQACASWDGAGTDSKFWNPSGVAKAVQSGADYFYIPDCYPCKIRKVSAAGVVTTVLMSVKVQNSNTPSADGVGTNAFINCPNGAAVDSSGLLHVSGFFDSTIRRVTDPGASVTTFAGSSAGLGIGNGGVLLSGATYNFADGTGTNALFYQPRGLAFDPSDNLYVCDSKNNALRRITPLGVVTTLGPHTNTVGGEYLLNGPQSVHYWQGNLYVGDTYRVRIVYPNGAVGALAGTYGDNGYVDGSGPGTFSKVGANWQGPMGLLVSPFDNLLYFVDTSNNALRTVSFLYPSVTSTASPSRTPTPTHSPTASPSPSPSPTPSESPTLSETATITPTASTSPSPTPTVSM